MIPHRSRAMSDLVVLGFDSLHTADEVLNKLRSMQKEYLINSENSCVFEREAPGKVYIKQAVNLTAVGARSGGASGAPWGTLVDLLFLNPLATIPPGSSALFILVKRLTEDKVMREIEPYKPRILKTSLSDQDEERLKTELRKAA